MFFCHFRLNESKKPYSNKDPTRLQKNKSESQVSKGNYLNVDKHFEYFSITTQSLYSHRKELTLKSKCSIKSHRYDTHLRSAPRC